MTKVPKVKQRRPVDDLAKLFAVFICAGIVGTFCSIFIMDAVIARTGVGNAIPLDTIMSNLKDIVLLIVGGAVSMAFNVAGKKPDEYGGGYGGGGHGSAPPCPQCGFDHGEDDPHGGDFPEPNHTKGI